MSAVKVNGLNQVIIGARSVTAAKKARKDRRRHNANAAKVGMVLVWGPK